MSYAQLSAKPKAVQSRNTMSVSKLVRLGRPQRPASAGKPSLTSVYCGIGVGDVAPDFTLANQKGKSVKLSKFRGLFGKPVVLYFYPSDGSPSCTKEAVAFRDSYKEFKKAGAEVIGVSSDDVESHADFAEENDLPFSLLVDEQDSVRKEYGIPKDFLGLLKGRQTYVIDKSGVVQMVFNSQFAPEKHVEEALAVL